MMLMLTSCQWAIIQNSDLVVKHVFVLIEFLFMRKSMMNAKKFVDKLKNETVLGNPLASGVTHGPVIHDRSMKKSDNIEDAVDKGAILLGGSKRPDLGENFHDLTVLGDVTTEMLITQEETFGPVAPLIKFKTDDEVIKWPIMTLLLDLLVISMQMTWPKF